MANIKEKIQKLLALATSPNENEARAALLKAKELMAANKLSEADFEEIKNQELIHVLCENVKWTTDSGDIWMTNLCDILCENYCCTAAWNHEKGRRTYTLIITGIGDDVQICKTAVEYAVGFVMSRLKIWGRKNKSASKSYASGFISGLQAAFEKQKEEHQEWGLVVQKSQEVVDYENSLGVRNVKTKQETFDPLAYLRGQKDGEEFNARKVLEG